MNQINNKKLFVKLGFGLDGYDYASIDFKTSALSTDEAFELVQMITKYNAYNGEQVAKVIKKIDELWPSTNQHVTFEFGREYSPVLYVNFPYWKSKRKLFKNRGELIEKSITLLKTCNPDELDVKSIGYRVRAWWD